MYSSLRLSKCLSFFVLPMLLVFSWQLRADDSVSRSDANDKEIAATWKLVDGITTRLMEEHISPPTRQQMVMSFCRGLYRSSESLPPAELSQIFSDCSTEEELRHAFERIWRENSAEDQINVNQRVFIAVNAMLRDCQPVVP